MAFSRNTLSLISGTGENKVFAYKTDDGALDVRTDGYFDEAFDILDKNTILLCQTGGGSLMLYITSEEIPVQTAGGSRIIMSGAIANNNAITEAEINAILTANNVEVPLTVNIALYMTDPTDNRDKVFLVKYAEGPGIWYFEKLNPAPLTAADVNAYSLDSLSVAVNSGSKIKRSEIELAISSAGLKVPTAANELNFTLYINDSTRNDRMYICRYDAAQNKWYEEKLKEAE